MKKMNFGKIAIVSAGAAAGGAAVVVASKFSPVSPMITNGVLVLAGAIIPELSKNDMLGGVGAGMIGAASANILTSMVPSLASVSGFDDVVNGLGDALEVEDYGVSGAEGVVGNYDEDDVM
jgi:hypothetical protein